MRLFLTLLLNAFAVFVTAYVLPGVELGGFGAALVVAVVLGLLNTLLKPILIFLTLPITILTLGLFTLVINVFLIYLTDAIVPNFQINGFLWAFVFGLVLSLVQGFLESLGKK